MDDKNTEKFTRRGTSGDAVDDEVDDAAPTVENENVRAAGDRDLGTTKVIDGEDDSDEPMDWGERWKITRQFASMSRSSAVLLITFLLVLLLYLWVKEDPVVTLPSGNADETSEPAETTEPAESTEPSGEPSSTDAGSETPSGTESAAPTTEDQASDGSQVPTQSGDGGDATQNGGTGDTGGQSGGQGGESQGTQDGAGTDQSAQNSGDGTALGADTEQNPSAGDTEGAEPA